MTGVNKFRGKCLVVWIIICIFVLVLCSLVCVMFPTVWYNINFSGISSGKTTKKFCFGNYNGEIQTILRGTPSVDGVVRGWLGYEGLKKSVILPMKSWKMFGFMIAIYYLCNMYLTLGGASILRPALYSPYYNTEGSVIYTTH